MARSYGKISSSIWTDPDFRALPDAHTQLLYLSLISQPDLSACGRLSIALRRWATGIAGSDSEQIHRSLLDLERHEFIMVDWDTDELVIRSFIKHDAGISNPRRLAAIQNAVEEIASTHLHASLLGLYPEIWPTDTTSIRATFDTRSANEERTPSEPNQQAIARSSEQQQRADLPEPAAAALDIYVAYRISTERGIRSPQRYGEHIRHQEMTSHLDALSQVELDANPRDIAGRVLGMTGDQIIEGLAALQRSTR